MDTSLAFALHAAALATPWLAGLAVAFANYGVFVLPVALVLLGWRRPELRRAVATGIIAGGVAFGLGLVLERVLSRPRPFVELAFEPLLPHAADSSFPSDHTLVGVALVGALAFARPRIGLWLLAWALLVGIARVVAGLHFATDIIGSALLALAIDALVWVVLRRAWH
ncbi:MAG: phosphatase PAP2 family protein [Chloroflexi bacterium]|nr:phosphatase PAP2 family protein [Chloroflexota bacterium]MBV9898577.1 phosphatase PAP2 family protein [Chloroflexota bacterium]